MFEMIVSTLSLIVGMVIANIIVESNPDLTNELASDPKAFAKDIIENYTGIFVFFQFVNAFCVAALVEEMVKYFSYRMVVTPDLNPRLRAVPLSTNVSSEEADHVDERRNSKKSTGSGITVAVSPLCAKRYLPLFTSICLIYHICPCRWCLWLWVSHVARISSMSLSTVHRPLEMRFLCFSSGHSFLCIPYALLFKASVSANETSKATNDMVWVESLLRRSCCMELLILS